MTVIEEIQTFITEPTVITSPIIFTIIHKLYIETGR